MIRVWIGVVAVCVALAACAAPVCDATAGPRDGGIGGTGGCAPPVVEPL